MLVFYWTVNHMDSYVKSLCGSEVTWKIKQLEVRGHIPQYPIASDADVVTYLALMPPTAG